MQKNSKKNMTGLYTHFMIAIKKVKYILIIDTMNARKLLIINNTLLNFWTEFL